MVCCDYCTGTDPMETDLEILAGTIAAHARELGGQEWEGEHRPVLMQILSNCGLAQEKGLGHWTLVGTVSLGDREIPTEAVVKALQEAFLSKRVKVLQQRLTEQLLKAAAKKVLEEEPPPAGD